MVMATYEPHNSTPLIWYPGVKDESIRAVPEVDQPIPMHLPVVFTYASKGPFEATIGSASTLVALYGEEIFDEKSPYGTLSTPFANLFKDYGNAMMVQRLHPKDMPAESRICLALEWVRSNNFRKTKRTVSGEHEYDANNHIVYSDEDTVDGILARWVLLPVSQDGRLGTIESRAGTLTLKEDTQAQAKIVPIFEFKAQWKGKHGNNIGLRFNPLTRKDGLSSQQEEVVADQNAFLYNLQVLRRPNERTDGTVVQTMSGENGVTFALKEGTYNVKAGNASIDFEEIFLEAYQDFDTRGGKKPRYGDIGSVYVYRENLEEVLRAMYQVEAATSNPSLSSATSVEDGAYLMNLFTGRDQKGRPYNAIYVQRELDSDEALSMTSGKTFWLSGGGDGTMNNRNFDALVKEIFDSMATGNERHPTHWRNQGRYPFKQIYDVGYSSETKISLFKVMSIRQEANVTMSTCDFINSPNKAPNPNEEESIGAILVSKARNYPESEIFGTGAVRANIIPQAMKLINNPRYKKYVPMTYEVARMRAQYMGGPGGMLAGYGYDQPPYNHVIEGKEVTNPYINVEARIRSWDNGVSYFINKTDTIMFCPGLKTVYKNDTSILTSDINMQIVCDVSYILFQIWTNLAGNSQLTIEDFCAKSDSMFLDRVRGRYDDRCVLIPHTYQDTKDKAMGASWSCKVDMYGNNSRTLNKSFVVTHRMEDLNG